MSTQLQDLDGWAKKKLQIPGSFTHASDTSALHLGYSIEFAYDIYDVLVYYLQ